MNAEVLFPVGVEADDAMLAQNTSLPEHRPVDHRDREFALTGLPYPHDGDACGVNPAEA